MIYMPVNQMNEKVKMTKFANITKSAQQVLLRDYQLFSHGQLRSADAIEMA